MSNITQTKPDEAKSISLADFLSNVPPNQTRSVDSVRTWRDGGAYLVIPELWLHCPEFTCEGHRFFRIAGADVPTSPGVQIRWHFLRFVCSNCQMSDKVFAIQIEYDRSSPGGVCTKFGELPPFGLPTPPRLLSMLGVNRELFLKGRRCKNQGLGIGAFGYYRRVVENQKNAIFDEIIKVAKKAAPDLIKDLEAAKENQQFNAAIEDIKPAIPPSLLIDGHHNPLTLLHKALSRGLHAHSDEACLNAAHDIRIVLGDLAERIGETLKKDSELSAALGRLMKD